MKDFRELRVWERAHRLVLDVYQATAAFPEDERYGLTGQIRRSAASIPSNIAEGCGRGSDADFARFVQVALGSASELDYQLLLARDLSYLARPAYVVLNGDLTRLRKMLNVFQQRLRGKKSAPTAHRQ